MIKFVNELERIGNIVNSLVLQIKLEQPYTAQHVGGVNKTAMAIAMQMRCFNGIELAYLNWGTMLHDFGKLLIPSNILLKPGDLTLQEYEVVTEHTTLGHKALCSYSLPQEVLDILLYHHERFDGEGYPFGLRGCQIPVMARVCAVADAYNAMTTDKPYRTALTSGQAIEEIIWNSATQFDPEIVGIFVKKDIAAWTLNGCKPHGEGYYFCQNKR